jgi:hypothetical protein
MEIKRFTGPPDCKACALPSVVFNLDGTLSKELLAFLVSNGFQEAQHFTRAGIFYIENSGLVATGMMGNATLTAKCKTNDCQAYIDALEGLLKQIG